MQKKHAHFLLIFFILHAAHLLGEFVMVIPMMIAEGPLPDYYNNILRIYFYAAYFPTDIFRKILPAIYLGRFTELVFFIFTLTLQTSIIYYFAKNQKKFTNTLI